MRFYLCLLFVGCAAPEDPSFVPKTFDLPVLRITSDAAVTSKEIEVPGVFTLAGPAGSEAGGALTIKGRGNTTWNYPKKPYAIDLEEKTELLGMPAGKDFVLLANYADKTLLRTALAFELSERLGMAYTTRSRFVELFLNDAYLGVYQLTEKIKFGKKRIDVSDEAFLLEIEPHTDAHIYIATTSGVEAAIREPDEPSAEQTASISASFQGVEDAIAAGDASAVLDEDSAIAWYWTNELLKNPDAALDRSVYLYKDTGAPLVFGPVWDFDLSGGNNVTAASGPEGYWVRRAKWFEQLFAQDAFTSKAWAAWRALDKNALTAFIDSESARLALGQEHNFRRWPILSFRVQHNPVARGSYAAEVAAHREWLTARIAWLDAQAP
ncbi:MAG: CotH kinase family protein [Deltaproteobacteria bacterium]|nr:CotH kinase family protein [Deltaproteobacteria bacterium]